MKKTELEQKINHNSKLTEQSARGLPLVLDNKTNLPMYLSKRELVQKYVIPVFKIRKFYDGMAEGQLYGTKCKNCGRLYFPPKADCESCMSNSISFEKLNGKARLLAYTVISVKPSSFSTMKDYMVAVGRLDEGVNVLSWLTGVKISEISIGMKLNLTIGRRMEDDALLYFFVPAK